MTDTALYYALSTIAQCAAALAALIGFLGLWRLDRMRERHDQVEQNLRLLLVGHLGITDLTFNSVPMDAIMQKVEQFIAQHRDDQLKSLAGRMDAARTRRTAISAEQERLMCVLKRFLRRTLVILALAIGLIVFAKAVSDWAVTAWIAPLLIILAGYRLGRDTYSVVREAARPIRSLVILALPLLLTTPAWASNPTRCTTYEERSLQRWQTVCDDGTRAVTTWSATGRGWQTTITESPELNNRLFAPIWAELSDIGETIEMGWR